MIWSLRATFPEDELKGCGWDIQPLDGDLRNVKPADLSVDIGHWPIPITEYWSSGRHMDTAKLPMRLSVKAIGCRKDRPALYQDFTASMGSDTLASAAFRDVVEAHDPGVHQFVPVQVEDAKGGAIEHDYFWFAPGHRIFALDAERTSPPMRPYPEGPDWINPHPDRPAMRFDRKQRSETWALVFRADKIGDRNLFCDGEFRRQIFISDRLKRAFEAAALVGVKAIGPHPVV